MSPLHRDRAPYLPKATVFLQNPTSFRTMKLSVLLAVELEILWTEMCLK